MSAEVYELPYCLILLRAATPSNLSEASLGITLYIVHRLCSYPPILPAYPRWEVDSSAILSTQDSLPIEGEIE